MCDFLEELYDMLNDCGIFATDPDPERGENLTRPGPKNIGGSWAAIDTRLPWYTSGFE